MALTHFSLNAAVSGNLVILPCTKKCALIKKNCAGQVKGKLTGVQVGVLVTIIMMNCVACTLLPSPRA